MFPCLLCEPTEAKQKIVIFLKFYLIGETKLFSCFKKQISVKESVAFEKKLITSLNWRTCEATNHIRYAFLVCISKIPKLL